MALTSGCTSLQSSSKASRWRRALLASHFPTPSTERQTPVRVRRTLAFVLTIALAFVVGYRYLPDSLSANRIANPGSTETSDFLRIVALGQLEAATHATDVRVDKNFVVGGGPRPAVREYNVGGLAPDSR
jgi:hypothetical protein